MKPIDFDGSNKILNKPEGWTDEECSPLHVYATEEACFSVWKMTLRERLRALFSGKVGLWVYTAHRTQPPVALVVLTR